MRYKPVLRRLDCFAYPDGQPSERIFKEWSTSGGVTTAPPRIRPQVHVVVRRGDRRVMRLAEKR